MGIFDLLKRKKNAENELVGYIKSNLKNPTDENVLKVLDKAFKPDDDLTHLTPEGELPWGWHSRYEPIIKPYEDMIIQAAVSLNTMSGNERIEQLEKLIKLYNEYKNFCYKKDECYIKYFSDMWEHCHNSQCKDFEYITPYIAELETLRKG